MAALKLPENLDIAAATSLAETFRKRRGRGLSVDASRVGRVGGLYVQVMLAAKAAWESDGKALKILQPSEAYCEAMRMCGAEALIPAGADGGVL